MKFDVSRVYTSVNADELKVGSKVIVADNLKDLKERVELDAPVVDIVNSIGPEWDTCRIATYDDTYALAYLVEEPAKLKWTDLKVGDVICNGTLKSIVIAIDERHDTCLHVLACDKGFPTLNWIGDDDLEKWEKEE